MALLQLRSTNTVHTQFTMSSLLYVLQQTLEENDAFKLAKRERDSKAVKITLVEPCSQCK